jgi:hypothetical protein
MKKQVLFLVTLFTFAFGTAFSRITDSTSVSPTDSMSVYPNPFACSTNITIKLIKSDTVTLILFNRWGQIVKTILKPTFMQSGSHSLKLFGDSLSQGSYVISLGIRSRKTIGKNVFKDSTAQSVSPIITASGATTFCDGGGVTLTSSISSGNKWSNGATTKSIFVTTPGAYYVSNTSNGCSSTSEPINISVLPKPKVSIVASTEVVCVGSPVILKASGAVFYTWSDSIKNGVAFVPATTKTYTVTGKDSNKCYNTAVKTIVVNKSSPPKVTASTNANVVCSGDAVTLKAGGANSYKWSTGETTSSITQISTATKTYTVVGIDSNKCFNSATVRVYVNPLPNVGISATATTICIGSSVILKATGATFYSWSPEGAKTSSITIAPQTTKTYTLTGTDSNGCSQTVVKTITVNSKHPTVSAKAILASGATNKVVCEGNEVTLYGLGAESYKWSNGVKDNMAFIPTATKTYTVTGTTNGCASTATVTVTLKTNTAPAISLSASALTVCEGMQVILSATATGNVLYRWIPEGDTTSSITVIPSFKNSTYTVRGIDANKCYQSATQTITLKEAPRVGTYASSNGVVCAGTPVTLKGLGANSYVWSGGIKDSIPFVPKATKTYTVVGTGTNNCKNAAVVNVVVNKLPAVSAGNSATICAGASVTFKGSGATYYYWSDSILDGSFIVPLMTKTYTVTGVDSNGCSKMAVKSVNVNQGPKLAVKASADIVCAGTPVTLKGTGAISYVWTGGIKDSVAFTPSATKTYTVTGTGANKCTNKASVSVYVNKLPNVGIVSKLSSVCPGTTVTLSGSGAVYYSWTGGIKNGVGFVAQVTKTYTVTGSDSNKCLKTAIKTIIVDSSYCDSIVARSSTPYADMKKPVTSSDLNIYPNPFSSQTTISFAETQTNTTVNIMDVLGNIVKTLSFSGKQLTIERGELNTGVYFVQITDSNKSTINKKIIIQ